MDNLADAVASLELDDNETMPYGRSHWDGKPAELHAMILKAAGPLTLFVNGLLGDKDSLDEATVEALWTDAINADWQGDLARLPDIDLYAGEAISRKRPALNMLSLSVTRSMHSRLCARFSEQATISLSIDPQLNQYLVDIDPEVLGFESTRLHHIPMRNGWFDLVDFSYPISLGWIAIYYGHAALLSHLVEHHGVDLGKFESFNGCFAMDLAAESGSLDVLKMLHHAGNTSCSQVAIDEAAGNGHLHVVKWLHANRTEGCTADAMNHAAQFGHLHVVKWLHANRTEGCTTRAMDGAAMNGHLDVVQWLHANRTEGCTTDAMDDAAKEGHLDVIKWLQENRTEGCSTGAMDCAAAFGRLEVVQWLHENRTEGCTTDAIDLASMNGHLDVVRWLHENRTEGCTADAMDRAASYGHLEVAQWLHANRTEGCSTEAMDMAAWGGQLEVVQWLHANRTEGCTTVAIKDAAMNGHLEVVRFLVACGYEFTFYALREAKDEAIVDVLVDSMTLERAMYILEDAMYEDERPELVERLERAVANKQA